MPARNNVASKTAPSSDRELVVSRVFDAPRELVWRAWTEPRHLAKWWGPRGFTTTIEVMDVRPGGEWRHVMHGPDGTDYPNRTLFKEVLKPEKIVLTNTGGRTEQDVQFESTWTFEDLGGKTRVTIRMVFATAQECERVAREYGAVEGGHQTLARLGEFLPILAAEQNSASDSSKASRQFMAPAKQELVLTREFDAPRALVWKAWTESKHVAQWWGPHGFQNPVCEVDARVGGAIVVHTHDPDGTVFPVKGEFREVVAPERLVFVELVERKSADNDAPEFLFELLNTITFTEHAGKTRVELRSQVLRTTMLGAPYAEGMETGWVESLERLAAVVTQK